MRSRRFDVCSKSHGYIAVIISALFNRAKGMFQDARREVPNSVTKIMHTCHRTLHLPHPEEV
jgi:hypothetical protein